MLSHYEINKHSDRGAEIGHTYSADIHSYTRLLSVRSPSVNKFRTTGDNRHLCWPSLTLVTDDNKFSPLATKYFSIFFIELFHLLRREPAKSIKSPAQAAANHIGAQNRHRIVEWRPDW